ncbi:MAG: hypothetical protein ABIL58_13840 [Pseudomonadota bacterium]
MLGTCRLETPQFECSRHENRPATAKTVPREIAAVPPDGSRDVAHKNECLVLLTLSGGWCPLFGSLPEP